MGISALSYPAYHPAYPASGVTYRPAFSMPAYYAAPAYSQPQPFNPFAFSVPPTPSYKEAIRAMPGADRMPPEIFHALVLLADIRHLPQDEAHMRRLGVDLVFRNGEEALRLILQKGIRVEFGDMGDTKAHAQWLKDDNLIMINQKYRGSLGKETLYAISEAIYHEAGHAARHGDDRASIQEEINCLSLNTLANRYHSATDPEYAQSTSKSALIADGVALYSRLFFDNDPDKKALVNRVIEKYGQLPPESPDHRIPMTPYSVPLADRVLRQLKVQRTAQWMA